MAHNFKPNKKVPMIEIHFRVHQGANVGGGGKGGDGSCHIYKSFHQHAKTQK